MNSTLSILSFTFTLRGILVLIELGMHYKVEKLLMVFRMIKNNEIKVSNEDIEELLKDPELEIETLASDLEYYKKVVRPMNRFIVFEFIHNIIIAILLSQIPNVNFSKISYSVAFYFSNMAIFIYCLTLYRNQIKSLKEVKLEYEKENQKE